MSYGAQENTAVPSAPTSGATSANAASASPLPATDRSCSTATTAAASAAFIPKHREWIELRGLDPDLAGKLGICTKREGGANWIAVPYVERGRTINHKYRLASEKRHRMDEGAPLTLWNHDVLLDQMDRPLVITEGEWDALTAIQSGFTRCVSVPNGAPQQKTENLAEAKRYEFLWRSKDLLDKVKQIIIAVDGDSPGRILAADLARWLGPERCRFVDYPTDTKDLNEVLKLYGSGAVAETLNRARPYPVKGLYRLDEFPEPPPTTSLSTGIDGLDDLFKCTLGTFTVISGWAGHGKTSLLMRMLANLMERGVNVALGSFETMPRPILERRLRACLYRCGEFGPKAETHGAADELLAKRLSVIAHTARDEDTELDLDYIIELAKVAVLRDGVRLLCLDPWNEIEHKRKAEETETEYTSRAIRSLKRFALNYECAVWLVAHPRKPHSDGQPKPPSLYDLAGCYSDDTEVLTNDGWKRHADLSLQDEVACFDPVTSSLSYQRPERIIRKDFDGDMFRFKGYGFDLLVTPEHRMVVAPRWANPVGTQASSGIGRPERWSKAGWNFCEAQYLPRAEFRMPIAAPLATEATDQITPLMAALAGWYVSEGCGTGNGVTICQAIGDRADQIERLLSALAIPFTVGDNLPGGKGGKLHVRKFYIGIRGARELVDWLKRECGVGSAYKCVPAAVFHSSATVKEAFLAAYLAGDGSPRRGDASVASTISERLKDDLQRLVIELGRSCSAGGKVNGRSESHSPAWQINVGSSKRRTAMFNPARNVTREAYCGPVWCLTVPGGAYVTRRNGKATICGNSAHFANKADYGLIIHRDDMAGTQIEARVVKVRMGLPGKPGRVHLNWDASLSDYKLPRAA